MTEHLRCRRGRYLVQVRVPRDLSHAYKAQFVERYLRTSDKGEAKERASAVVAGIAAEFKAKREGVAPATMSPPTFSAMRSLGSPTACIRAARRLR